MNIVFISGYVTKDPEIYVKDNQSPVAILDISVESKRKMKEFHKIACFGSLAEMVKAKIKETMYVTVMGVVERKSYKKGGAWNVRTQIVAKQIMIPIHPKFSKWLQLALMMAEGADFEGEPEAADSGEEEDDPGDPSPGGWMP